MRQGIAEVQVRATAESPIEHTEWQRPFSGVHSIMMEKLAQAVEDGGARPPPFNYNYHHVQKVVVYAPAGRAEPVFVNV